MAENKHKNEKRIAFFLIAAVIIVLSILTYSMRFKISAENDAETGMNVPYRAPSPFVGDSQSAVLKLPAVSANNTGVSAYLTVNARKGAGNVFLDVNSVLSKEDTQHSARLAAEFSKKHEKIKSETVDLFYSIRALAPVIEGPSAGAAFAIASIAALRNETPAPDVMITGTLNHDGTIGPSGKILEKARAAKEAGASLFLVPLGSLSDIDINYTEDEYCAKWGDYEYCYPEITPKIINASKDAGIDIIEVATVDDALGYFRL